ncbi:MAG: phage major capsid protein [Prevotellaceae bacterium]|jgi:HK97 family phage major capsid protein|nr:phage major capsid protein [Prevotellaceae bacterium]
MTKIKTLYKNSKKNSLYGMKAKRNLKFIMFAGIVLMLVGIMCIATETLAGYSVGSIMATAPFALVIPTSNKKIIKDKKSSLEKSFAKIRKTLDDDSVPLLDQIMEEINSLYDMADNEGQIEIFNKLQEKLTELEGKLPTAEDAAAAEEELKELKQTVAELKQLGAGTKVGTFRKQLEDFMKTDQFKEAIKSGKNQVLQIKAAAAITTANAANAPHGFTFEIIPGIQEKPTEELTVLLILNKGKTSSRTIIWINRADKDGGSAFIAEGALKPLKDWTYQEQSSVAKKIAVRSKVSTEMLNDFEYMESEIRNLLEKDLMKVVDQKLLTGDGGSVEPKGLITGASAYVGTELDGTIINPTNPDAIRAAMLQMRLLNFRPNILLLNPSDVAAIDLIKTADGHYIKVETDAIMQNVKVIETTEITAGNFLLIDTSKWFVRILEDLDIQFGYENDDFTKNLVTVIAEMRLHSYQYSVDAGSVVYDSLATVKTALAMEEI